MKNKYAAITRLGRAKKIITASSVLFLWCFFACYAVAQPYEAGYDKRAQDVVHNLLVHNGLDAEIWPDYKPSAWPVLAAATNNLKNQFEKKEKLYGVSWSNTPVKQLTALVIKDENLGGALDLSGLSGLERLYVADSFTCDSVQNNKDISAIALNGNSSVKEIYFSETSLASLELGELSKLESFELQLDDGLKILNTGANAKLSSLGIESCVVANLDLSANSELTRLSLANTDVREIDVSANAKLQVLKLVDCHIETVDLGRNGQLSELSLVLLCITSLDLSENRLLKKLLILGTPLSSLALPASTQAGQGKTGQAQALVPQINDTGIPLSGLARLADHDIHASTQWGVFSGYKAFAPGEKAILDFSSEAVLLGADTTFTLLTEVKVWGNRTLKPVVKVAPANSYKVKNGIITITKPGRYYVLMTNPKILSRVKGASHKVKIPALTGRIEVGKDNI